MKKKEQERLRELGRVIKQKFEIARDHKQSELGDRIQRNQDLVNGVAINSLHPSIDYDINPNIISPIITGVLGMLRDVYGTDIENQVILDRTPIVDLSQTSTDRVQRLLESKIQALIMQGTPPTEQYTKEMRDMMFSAEEELQRQEADAAAIRLQKKLKDHLITIDWFREFDSKALQYFLQYPTLIGKAPSYKMKRVKVWEGDKPSIEIKLLPVVEVIHPDNFFPAPNTVDIRSAYYIIEVRRMSNPEFWMLNEEMGFNADALQLAREEYPKGHMVERENGEEKKESIDGKPSSEPNKNPEKSYEVLGYYGMVEGEVLSDFGVDMTDEEKDRMHYAEVWVVGTIPIKARLVNNNLTETPFYTVSFQGEPNSIWGTCPVTRMEWVQRSCTSAIAHLFRNLSFTAGPMVEVQRRRLINGGEEFDEEGFQFEPYTVMETLADGTNTPVLTVHEMQSKVNDFWQLYKMIQAEAYTAIGVEPHMFGKVDQVKTVGRNSGSTALLMKQAALAIKHAMVMLERYFINPCLQTIADYIIENDDDLRILGDVQVRVKGIAGLEERAAKAEDLDYMAQTFKDAIPQDAWMDLVAQILEAKGMDASILRGKGPSVDNAIQQDIGAAAGVGVPPAGQPMGGSASPVDLPMVDNRNPAALQGLETNNGLLQGV